MQKHTIRPSVRGTHLCCDMNLCDLMCILKTLHIVSPLSCVRACSGTVAWVRTSLAEGVQLWREAKESAWPPCYGECGSRRVKLVRQVFQAL